MGKKDSDCVKYTVKEKLEEIHKDIEKTKDLAIETNTLAKITNGKVKLHTIAIWGLISIIVGYAIKSMV